MRLCELRVTNWGVNQCHDNEIVASICVVIKLTHDNWHELGLTNMSVTITTSPPTC